MSDTGQLDKLVDPTRRGGSRSSLPHVNLNSSITTGLNTSTVGLLHNTLLPSLSLHTGLSLGAYAVARTTKRVDAKDVLWASGLTVNAWYHAFAPRTAASDGLAGLGKALRDLTSTQKLVLGGITIWGSRLSYRILSRCLRRGRDDPRYDSVNQNSDFWDKALFSTFLPEAVFQALISLSWAIPLRLPGTSRLVGTPGGVSGALHALAIGLYGAGLGMEVLADVQQESKKRKGDDLETGGVWSIVRHPNYLGDTLVHFSIPLLLYANNLFHPLTLVGPLANLAFLRFVGGDKETEASQEQRYKVGNTPKYAQMEQWKETKNSFWPAPQELHNQWTWVLVGIGAATAAFEKMVRDWV